MDTLPAQEQDTLALQPEPIIDQTAQTNQEIPVSSESSPVISHAVNNGYSNGSHHPSHSADNLQPGESFSPPQENDAASRHSSPTLPYQPPPPLQPSPSQPISRPGSSGLSGGGERYGYPQSYQEQNQRQQPATQSKNSVVIKVGMVGDAQIGKTSLMVKYVEGSWDEDYIQTLGEDCYSLYYPASVAAYIRYNRCQFHGEDDLDSEYRNHLLYLGSGWTKRIC